MRIRAAVLRHPSEHVEVEDVELDAPRGGEVLVKVAAAGVCHSDVRHADGELGAGLWPAVMGHEGAGVVEAVGEGVTHVAPGDPVAFCSPRLPRLPVCLAGKPNLCLVVGEHGAHGRLMDGTSRLRLPDGTVLQHGLRTACFAEYTVVAAGGADAATGTGPSGRRRSSAAGSSRASEQCATWPGWPPAMPSP